METALRSGESPRFRSGSLHNAEMRLVVIISQLDLGGAERHLALVLPKLKQRGIEITTISLRSKGRLAPELQARGIDVHSLLSEASGVIGVVNGVIALARHVRVLRPHVVHFFLPKAYLLGSLATLGLPVKRVMSRRSLANYQKGRFWVRLVEQLCHKNVDLFLGNSTAVVGELKNEGIISERLGLLRNGIELKELASDRSKTRAELGVGEKVFVLICVANLFPYKGHLDLINALGNERNSIAFPWEIFFIGRDEGIADALRANADRVGVGSHIRWVEDVSDVTPYLSIADLFVLPSHEEGFSNALLEAMMAGLPIVATAVGGNLDAIRDGADGLLVPPHSPQQLGEALLTLALDPALRKRLGQSAKARAIEHFSLEACVQKYADLYTGLVEGRYPPLPPSLQPDGDALTCAE